jgi:hypothetical protein
MKNSGDQEQHEQRDPGRRHGEQPAQLLLLFRLRSAVSGDQRRERAERAQDQDDPRDRQDHAQDRSERFDADGVP